MPSCIALSGAGLWDSAPLEADLLQQADRLAGSEDAWLIIGDTALPKKGRASVGVPPRYASALVENANCQTMVSLTFASSEVPVMIGLRLFLPSDTARLGRAKVPEASRAHRTKPEIAVAETDRIRSLVSALAASWLIRNTDCLRHSD